MKKNVFSVLFSMLLVFSITTVAFADTVYEAEDANLIGAAKVEEVEGASGGKYVLGFDDPANDAVEFKVNVEKEGSYTVEVAYATETEGATGIFTVGNTESVVNFPSTGGWSDNGFEIAKTTLDFTEGENVVKVVRGNEYVQLDYIKVIDNESPVSDQQDSNSTEVVENPKTGDIGIAPYIALALIAFVGGFVLVMNRRRNLNE